MKEGTAEIGRIIEIDVIKFLMEVVVSIHVNPFRSLETIDTPYNQIISASMVPFFFVASGYLTGAGAMWQADSGVCCSLKVYSENIHNLRAMVSVS